MTEYEKKLEQFRSHYKIKYGLELDVTLYFFVRVNEMQKDLRKEIRKIPAARFRTGWDYFSYGLGKDVYNIVLTISVLIVVLIILRL